MRYYPALLDLQEKKCTVIGGGAVAERKVRSLLKAGASVFVISPNINKGINELKKNREIIYKKSHYQKRFTKGSFLMVAATDNKSVNSRVSRDALKLGLLVNVVDSAQESNFIVPAVLANQGLIIAISTSGRAPSLSKKIKEDLQKIFMPKYLKWLKLWIKRL
jgi:precorrin-2 dehydrogenase/sirohydrochlorin ferrochelatase